MSVYVTCKCDITSGHLLSCPMASVTTFGVAADYYFLKAQLADERQRADAMEAAAKDMAQVRDWAALRAEAAEANLIAERQRAERLEAALREIADGSRWELAPDIAKSALGSICTTERHPNCYGEGCPWCIAHDSIHMAEPKGEP